MNRVATRLRCITTSKPLFSTVRFSSQLFVSRLSFYSTDEELKRIFSPFGDVKEARLVMDYRTGRTKGYGFVTYDTEAEAQSAIKALDGRIIKGRVIFVEHAKSRKADGDDAEEN